MAKPKDTTLSDLYSCFLMKRAIPAELANAFVERYRKGRNGEVRSWDEVFGKPTRYGTGKRIAQQIEEEHLVGEAVAKLKAEGGSLNEEAFDAIGRKTKGVRAAKSKVKTLWTSHRFWTDRVNALLRLGRD
jgi:hypothetical protein